MRNSDCFLIYLARFQKPASYDDDDLDNSYFRRKPTSFLSSNDAKRYTWMAPDDESVRMEGPGPLNNGGPYIVGSYPPKSSFLSQSSEQITGWEPKLCCGTQIAFEICFSQDESVTWKKIAKRNRSTALWALSYVFPIIIISKFHFLWKRFLNKFLLNMRNELKTEPRKLKNTFFPFSFLAAEWNSIRTHLVSPFTDTDVQRTSIFQQPTLHRTSPTTCNQGEWNIYLYDFFHCGLSTKAEGERRRK